MHCDEFPSSTYKMPKEKNLTEKNQQVMLYRQQEKYQINVEDGSYLHAWSLNDPPSSKCLNKNGGVSIRYLIHPPVNSQTKIILSGRQQLYCNNTIYESSTTIAHDGRNSWVSGDDDDIYDYGNNEFQLYNLIVQFAQGS